MSFLQLRLDGDDTTACCTQRVASILSISKWNLQQETAVNTHTHTHTHIHTHTHTLWVESQEWKQELWHREINYSGGIAGWYFAILWKCNTFLVFTTSALKVWQKATEQREKGVSKRGCVELVCLLDCTDFTSGNTLLRGGLYFLSSFFCFVAGTC